MSHFNCDTAGDSIAANLAIVFEGAFYTVWRSSRGRVNIVWRSGMEMVSRPFRGRLWEYFSHLRDELQKVTVIRTGTGAAPTCIL